VTAFTNLLDRQPALDAPEKKGAVIYRARAPDASVTSHQLSVVS
jgi:hypothetical protein